jgi:hypothetical protein
MLTYLGSFAAVTALVLGVCFLDGDFNEGGLFAEMAKRVTGPKLRRTAPIPARVVQNPS